MLQVGRVNQEFVMLQIGDIFNIGKAGSIISYIVLSKQTVRGRHGSTSLEVRNIATNIVSTISKKEILDNLATIESIGHRKPRASVTAPTANAAQTVTPALAPIVVVQDETKSIIETSDALPVSKFTECHSMVDMAKMSNKIHKEMKEIYDLLMAGNVDAAVDLAMN